MKLSYTIVKFKVKVKILVFASNFGLIHKIIEIQSLLINRSGFERANLNLQQSIGNVCITTFI